MSRAYLRLDPAFDERKESYPDGPYAALIATFCLAETQPQRGRFRSLDYLTRLLGRRGRHARYLVEHGDLTVLEDGRAYVDGWDEWQEGDWKVAERVDRIRNRQRRTPPVTVDVTVPVTVDVTPSRQSVAVGGKQSGAEQAREDLDAFLLINRRAPTPRQRALLDGVLDRHDLTGAKWAADIMLRHPDDPIGAVIKADGEWRAEQIAKAQEAEKPKPQPRRSPGLPRSTRELLEEWKKSEGDAA